MMISNDICKLYDYYDKLFLKTRKLAVIYIKRENSSKFLSNCRKVNATSRFIFIFTIFAFVIPSQYWTLSSAASFDQTASSRRCLLLQTCWSL